MKVREGHTCHLVPIFMCVSACFLVCYIFVLVCFFNICAVFLCIFFVPSLRFDPPLSLL